MEPKATAMITWNCVMLMLLQLDIYSFADRHSIFPWESQAQTPQWLRDYKEDIIFWKQQSKCVGLLKEPKTASIQCSKRKWILFQWAWEHHHQKEQAGVSRKCFVAAIYVDSMHSLQYDYSLDFLVLNNDGSLFLYLHFKSSWSRFSMLA